MYTVLTTLTKLIAPVVPFLTEEMFQNLCTDADPVSVHLCDYPQLDERLIDAELSEQTEALFDLVTLGSAARNASKIKVRQPLAELKVYPGTDNHRRAVERFGDQLTEELNLKRVSLSDVPLLKDEVKANLKTLGPKFGQKMQQVKGAIESADPARLRKTLDASGTAELSTPGGPVTIDAADVVFRQTGPEGWAGAAERGTQVLLDARVTPELASEGTSRHVVRQVQDSRKNAELEMEDRIELYLGTDSPKLREAIDAHRDTIMAETLTTIWATAPLTGEAYRATVKVDGQPLTIELRKV
jgi:isoleucyl-tRNA synthetase